MTINEMLLKLGIAPHYLGFHYLKKAIEIVKDNFEKKQFIFNYTALYHDVAKEMNTTASRVERAIRHAIETAFDKPSNPSLHKIFDKVIDPDSYKVSNSCFIATIANHLIEEEANN